MLIKNFDPSRKHSNRQNKVMGISNATESPVASLDSRHFWLCKEGSGKLPWPEVSCWNAAISVDERKRHQPTSVEFY